MGDDEILHELIFIDEGFNLRRSEEEKSHRYFEYQMFGEQRRYSVIWDHLDFHPSALVQNQFHQHPHSNPPIILSRAGHYGGILRTIIK